MAHVGQKLALGNVGRFCPDFRRFQLGGTLSDQSLQLVVGIGQFTLACLDLGEHGVEAVHQFAHLILRMPIHPQGIILVCPNLACRHRQFVDRVDDPLYQAHAQQQ